MTTSVTLIFYHRSQQLDLHHDLCHISYSLKSLCKAGYGGNAHSAGREFKTDNRCLVP